MPILRDMLLEDLPAVSALGIRSKASWGYTAEEMAVFTEELTHPPELLTESITAKVAMLNEQIVGYQTVRRHADSTIELDCLFVDPDHFHAGIGTALLTTAITAAQESGAQELLLISDPYAVGFYQKFGAKIVGQHDSSIPNRQIPIMTLPIGPAQK